MANLCESPECRICVPYHRMIRESRQVELPEWARRDWLRRSLEAQQKLLREAQDERDKKK